MKATDKSTGEPLKAENRASVNWENTPEGWLAIVRVDELPEPDEPPSFHESFFLPH